MQQARKKITVWIEKRKVYRKRKLHKKKSSMMRATGRRGKDRTGGER